MSDRAVARVLSVLYIFVFAYVFWGLTGVGVVAGTEWVRGVILREVSGES